MEMARMTRGVEDLQYIVKIEIDAIEHNSKAMPGRSIHDQRLEAIQTHGECIVQCLEHHVTSQMTAMTTHIEINAR
jgi:hypothetical protein